MKRVLLGFLFTVALLIPSFFFGWAYARFGTPPEEIFLTDHWSILPSEQPISYGLLIVVIVLCIHGTFVVSFGLTRLLIRWGLLIHVTSLGMLGAGLFGATMALFGQHFGFRDDQRGGMAIVAVFLSGMGLLMLVAVIRDTIRKRAIERQKRAADPRDRAIPSARAQ